jgi:hypothetical protein
MDSADNCIADECIDRIDTGCGLTLTISGVLNHQKGTVCLDCRIIYLRRSYPIPLSTVMQTSRPRSPLNANLTQDTFPHQTSVEVTDVIQLENDVRMPIIIHRE